MPSVATTKVRSSFRSTFRLPLPPAPPQPPLSPRSQAHLTQTRMLTRTRTRTRPTIIIITKVVERGQVIITAPSVSRERRLRLRRKTTMMMKTGMNCRQRRAGTDKSLLIFFLLFLRYSRKKGSSCATKFNSLLQTLPKSGHNSVKIRSF